MYDLLGFVSSWTPKQRLEITWREKHRLVTYKPKDKRTRKNNMRIRNYLATQWSQDQAFIERLMRWVRAGHTPCHTHNLQGKNRKAKWGREITQNTTKHRIITVPPTQGTPPGGLPGLSGFWAEKSQRITGSKMREREIHCRSSRHIPLTIHHVSESESVYCQVGLHLPGFFLDIKVHTNNIQHKT